MLSFLSSQMANPTSLNTIAVATTEADEAIASSDFLKIMGISPPKGANQGDSGQF